MLEESTSSPWPLGKLDFSSFSHSQVTLRISVSVPIDKGVFAQCPLPQRNRCSR